MVDHKCKEYEHHVEELEHGRERAENDYQDAFDELAPGTEQTESETAEEQTVESKILFILTHTEQLISATMILELK